MSEGEMSLEVAALKQLEKQKKIDFLAADVESLFLESKDGLDRVARIVKGLRTFSRVDRLDVFAEYDLNEGVTSTLVVARNEVKYHADVETELGSVPMILASGGQINQVLLNIIVNASHAIKANDETRRGLIRIRTFEEENQVGCSIYNNGPVIPPDIIHRIFEPFFTTKKVGQGTGLGLSISYDIVVNLHHGRMTVVSSEADGTIFTFFLPVIPVVSNEEGLQGGRQ
jgi:signal transduction histidine kinase